jgi:hypothetical protein
VSIGLRLLAKLNAPASDPDLFLQQIAVWVKEKCSDVSPQIRQGFVDTYPTLFCRFHPGAEEVELSLIDLEHLTSSANTSTVGPGYHIYLCSVLQAWARDFQATWLHNDDNSSDYFDEAGYFFTGDEGLVFEEMTSWLQTLASTFFDGTFQADDRGIALCMSMDVQYEADALAIAPLGPRDREWLRKTSQEGTKGTDFFAWLQPGMNAEYFLGRVLTQMWTDVRWRKPVNDSERKLLKDVVNSLEIAQKLDSGLELPYAEWAEILEYLGAGNEEIEHVRSRRKTQSLIGYRRGDVTASLPGGWRVRLPGSFSDFEADKNCDHFALDPPREIWFTSYRFTAPSPRQTFESMKQEILRSQPEFLLESGDYIAKATIQEEMRETGEKYFVLSSSNVCRTQRAVCTILFDQPDQREWALGVWRSIQRLTSRETD